MGKHGKTLENMGKHENHVDVVNIFPCFMLS
jgi:hypothetical protein